MKTHVLTALAFPCATLLLGGCVAAGDVRPYPAMAPVVPVVAPVAQATPGAIYQAGPGLSLYSDRIARDVGDLLTINLVESTTAQTSATTQVGKTSDISMSAPEILGAPVTYNGRDILSATISGERDFDGQGKSSQSNRLQGSVTVTVIQRLPNGNLVVQGQKNMRLNQGDELVQIQGVVRPADINLDNSVPSSRVGEARIVYGGRGAIAQSNAMGWLGRFFNTRLYPY
ncbi:flagellar basal body L-ring protein FlgH [Pseudoxanthomonas daejeonensis]|uniref:flagellar basal body L-ring protein FlgH n=1 Tax=Pseudoxanthomonas daejeonensis TaxID=266062 RepID=UPI001F546260|nr:flagellar basal body L-ring protein FlgH [Pseudoxanthomonas daejeonensis]UNK57299.1 flagellar basal body L-ring protein FlgH [Pseudoxanthomonas daejeonensis]